MRDFFGEPGAPSFDDPLGMLRACHGRIERQLLTLGRLVRHLPEHGADADARAADVVRMLDDADCHVYVCGLKAMEAGVDAAFADACRQHGRDWSALVPLLRAAGRYHVETY